MQALTLLLITQVSAEWVEISQQHYRKPVRTHHFTTPAKDVEDSTRPWSNNNRSVAEYNWNISPARTPNVGNVKRIQLLGGTVRTTEVLNVEDQDSEEDIIKLRPNYRPTDTPLEFNEHVKQKGNIERVPNLGNVKRVQLHNTPVKSQAIQYKGDRLSNNRPKINPHNDEMKTKVSKFEDYDNDEAFTRRTYVNKGKKGHVTERPVTLPPDDQDTFNDKDITQFNNKGLKRRYKNYTTTNLYSRKPTFVTETVDFNKYDTHVDKYFRITDSKRPDVTENPYLFTTEDISTFNTPESTTEVTFRHQSYKHENKMPTHLKVKQDDVRIAGNEKELSQGSNNKPSLVKSKQTQSENLSNNENLEENVNDSEKTPNRTKTDNKVNTIENVLKFITVVADTISKNSRRSFGDKMQYLHELKDSILVNIENRIEATWPDEGRPGARRQSRSAHASPRGHVHVPSSESALMTISFLTFAVFLIKLVLQVIHTYKNKAMMVAPLMVAAAGRNVFSHQHRV